MDNCFVSHLDHDRPFNTASQATYGFLHYFVCISSSVSIDVTSCTERLRGIVLHGECMIWYMFTPAADDSSPGSQQQAKSTGTRKKNNKTTTNPLKRNTVTSIYRLIITITTSLAKEVMFLVALVCLSVCGQHYSKSYKRIKMKFYGGVLGSTMAN